MSLRGPASNWPNASPRRKVVTVRAIADELAPRSAATVGSAGR